MEPISEFIESDLVRGEPKFWDLEFLEPDLEFPDFDNTIKTKEPGFIFSNGVHLFLLFCIFFFCVIEKIFEKRI